MKINPFSTVLGREKLLPPAQGVKYKFFLLANFSNIHLMCSSLFDVFFNLDKSNYNLYNGLNLDCMAKNRFFSKDLV